MKIKQMYAVMDDINKQMFGKKAVDVVDLQGLISMGKAIEDCNGRDNFVKLFTDRIGKTRIRQLDLELSFPSLFMDSFTFGGILQKISVESLTPEESTDWNVGNDDFTPNPFPVRKMNVSVKYFDGASTCSFILTIPDELFDSAFTSEAGLIAFFTACTKALNDSVTISINNMSRTAINNFVAEKFKVGHGCINLLSEYNTTFPNDTITAAETIYNPAFERFASWYVMNYIGYLEEPSVLYNVGGKERATSRDNMHILCLEMFANASKVFLESDTYWKEMLALPNYTPVKYWQANKDGNGKINTFDTNSTISVIPSSEDGAAEPEEVTVSGVLMVLADREAIAVGLNKRRSASARNNLEFYTDYKEEFTTQWINDTDENGIIFYVADE